MNGIYSTFNIERAESDVALERFRLQCILSLARNLVQHHPHDALMAGTMRDSIQQAKNREIAADLRLRELRRQHGNRRNATERPEPVVEDDTANCGADCLAGSLEGNEGLTIRRIPPGMVDHAPGQA